MHKEESVTIVYGRFNPITHAHEKLIRFAQNHAKKHNSDFFIFTSHTEDRKNNPLTYEEKIELLSLMYGHKTVYVYPESNIFDIIEHLSWNYKNIYIVVGGDRYNKFEELAKKYQKDYDARLFIVRFAERNKYLISATDMRNYARTGQYKKFIDNCPEQLGINQKFEVYRKVARKLTGTVRIPNEPKGYCYTGEA